MNGCRSRRSRTLPNQVRSKLLPRAEDYLPLLEMGVMDIGGGFTTDTQSRAGYDPAERDAYLKTLARTMRGNVPGAYLRFHRLKVPAADP